MSTKSAYVKDFQKTLNHETLNTGVMADENSEDHN